MKKSILQIIAGCFFVLSVFTFAQAQNAPLAGFDEYVEKALRDWEIPGVAIAIVKDDKVILAKGYGVKELNNSPAMVYKRLYDAVQRKDLAAIKSVMSKKSLEFAEFLAQNQKRTVDVILKYGFFSPNSSPTFPKIRDERVKGNFAKLEVKNLPFENSSEDSGWIDVGFVKENGEWKIAIGDMFAGDYKKPDASQAVKQSIQKFENSTGTKNSTIIPDAPLIKIGVIDQNTIFGIASHSKAFTATALAILVDEGKLNWDDKVTKYLPDFRLYDEYVTNELTIRDLLTHRNGLAAYGGDILWWGGDYSRDEIIRRVRFVKPKYSFRSTYAYQNIPFITAGKIVEKVSGTSWENFVKTRIFAPLRMKETTTSITEIRGNNKVAPHFRDIEKGKTFPIAWRNLDAGAPAAGINSNVIDMANWLRLNLNNGNFEGKQIVSERQMQAIHSPQMLIPFAPSANPKLKTNFRAYGFGWNIREYQGFKMIHHGGWTDGMLTQSAMLPEKKLGVTILTNIHNREIANAFIYKIFDEFIGAEKTDWSAFFLNNIKEGETAELDAIKKRETERVKDSKTTLPLGEYAGIYHNELYGNIEFKEENGKLVVRLAHSPTYIGDLSHWQFNTFRVVWRDPVAEKTFLEFTVQDKQVSSVKMAMAGFIEDNEYEYLRK